MVAVVVMTVVMEELTAVAVALAVEESEATAVVAPVAVAGGCDCCLL